MATNAIPAEGTSNRKSNQPRCAPRRYKTRHSLPEMQGPRPCSSHLHVSDTRSSPAKALPVGVTITPWGSSSSQAPELKETKDTNMMTTSVSSVYTEPNPSMSHSHAKTKPLTFSPTAQSTYYNRDKYSSPQTRQRGFQERSRTRSRGRENKFKSDPIVSDSTRKYYQRSPPKPGTNIPNSSPLDIPQTLKGPSGNDNHHKFMPKFQPEKRKHEKLSQNRNIRHASTVQHKKATPHIDRERIIKNVKLQLMEVSQQLLVDKRRREDNLSSQVEKIKPKSQKNKQKFVALDAYEKREAEMAVMMGKLEDLRAQINEFSLRLESLDSQIEESMNADRDTDFTSAIVHIKCSYKIEVDRFATGLPMYGRRSEIVALVNQNQVSLIMGETGSGKSTNIIQYLYEAGYCKDKKIVCTQPRKIAAMMLAKRVSGELKDDLGQLVGYSLGTNSKYGPKTRLLYTTDHFLLSECIKDHDMSTYSCIIIDEAHERSVQTDLLLGMIKRALVNNADLKLVITSATIDPKPFIRYFDGCKLLQVAGRLFPVDVVYSSRSSSENDYITASVQKVTEICSTQPEGDVLVFLTTPADTERASKLLAQLLKADNSVLINQLHGKLQQDEQQVVFKETPPGKRKVIFATNSAETSITIPGIKFVVDSGFVKEMTYNPVTDFSALKVCRVSQSSANQRKGRAGRVESGVCYRLYTEEEYNIMPNINQPEILRVNLAQAMLKLMALGIQNPQNFEFVQPPSPEALHLAKSCLNEIGATLNGSLTSLGQKLSKLSVPPRLGKAALLAIDQQLGFEMVVAVIMSTLSQSVFFRVGSPQDKDKADRLKARFCHENGDILTYIDLYKEWYRVDERKKSKWCVENAVNAKSMRIARDGVKDFFMLLKQDLSIHIRQQFNCQNSIASTEKKMCQIICSCFSANLCYFSGHPRVGYYTGNGDKTLVMHPSSSLQIHGILPQWVIYLQVLTTSQDFMLNITRVESDWIQELIAEKRIKLTIDMSDMAVIELKKVQVNYIGRSLMQKIVGPKFTLLKGHETSITDAVGSTVILEASYQKSILEVYCPSFAQNDVERLVDEILLNERDQLRSERVRAVVPSSNTELLVGEGGQVAELILPGDYFRVIIRQVDLSSERLVRSTVNTFEGVHDMETRRFHKDSSCNIIVTFKCGEDCSKFVDYCRTDQCDFNFPIHPLSFHADSASRKLFSHSIRFQWTRRCKTGFGVIYFENIDEIWQTFSSLNILDSDRCICTPIPVYWNSDRDNHRCCKLNDVPTYVNENDITKAVDLERSPYSEKFRVTLFRQKAVPEGKAKMFSMERQLKDYIENHIGNAHYSLKLHSPREKDYFYSGFLNLKSELDWQILKAQTSNFPLASDRKIEFDCRMEASLVIQPNVFESMKPVVVRKIHAIENMHSENNQWVKVDISPSRNNNSRLLKIQSNNFEQLDDLIKEFETLLTGFEIPCTNNQMKILKCKSGSKFLRENVPKHMNVILDERAHLVRLFGAEPGEFTKVQSSFTTFFGSIVSREISLIDDGKPPGVLKRLLVKYGPSLDALCLDTLVFSVELSVRNHILKVCGTEGSIELVFEKLSIICNELADRPVPLENALGVDCPVCMCPVEQSCLYCTESCGHAYCDDCIHRLVYSAIDEKNIPIACALKGCDQLIAIADLRRIMGRHFPGPHSQQTGQPLLSASLDTFVSKHRDSYHYCNTPDCPSIYRVTPDSAQHYSCAFCGKMWCTRCHNDAHQNGVTCLQINLENDSELKKWREENPQNRAHCPKCKAPIEKDGGCMHMTCANCQAHICWRCKNQFDTPGHVYNHLASCTADGSTGGIFE